MGGCWMAVTGWLPARSPGSNRSMTTPMRWPGNASDMVALRAPGDGRSTPPLREEDMNSTARLFPAGLLTAVGAVGVGVAYGAGIRSWKLAAVVVAAAGLVGLDVV